jgi:hypothetical protein
LDTIETIKNLQIATPYVLPRSGNTITRTTLSAIATIDFEKSQKRATAPGFLARG